jgi:hypothetical protein
MNVQEFMQESMFQIAAAVNDVNRRFTAEKMDAIANPEGAARRSRGGGVTYCSISDTQMIEFDIAVTVSQTEGQSKEIGGGLKVYVASGSAGTGTTTEEMRSSVSHLKFKVPLKLPTLPKQ